MINVIVHISIVTKDGQDKIQQIAEYTGDETRIIILAN